MFFVVVYSRHGRLLDLHCCAPAMAAAHPGECHLHSQHSLLSLLSCSFLQFTFSRLSWEPWGLCPLLWWSGSTTSLPHLLIRKIVKSSGCVTLLQSKCLLVLDCSPSPLTHRPLCTCFSSNISPNNNTCRTYSLVFMSFSI